MEACQNMQVHVISTETIKPETPTPSHLTNLSHSLLDQKYPPTLVPTLLFYSAPVGAAPLDITRLKTCLSQTLSIFYPFAGRYETWGTTLCNDEGVPFVVAQVNCPLSVLLTSLNSSSDVDLGKFYPPKESLLTSGVHVAIQVNVFTCGGFALGWYHTHKVTDATSAATFLRHWAALVIERHEDAAQSLPDFSAAAVAYPPVPEEDRRLDLKVQPLNNNFHLPQKRIIARSFAFSNASLVRLKAASASEKLADPSRFMAVAGFIWQHILLGSSESNKEEKSLLTITVDLRTRCDPVLPKGTIGNLVEIALAKADKRAQLPDLVGEIHRSISEMKDIVADYQGEKRVEAKEKHWQKFVKEVIEYRGKDVYVASAWCKSAGFGDVDFGFGNPDWYVPIDDVSNHGKMNFIYFTDFKDSDGHGFEAWMFLEEEQIKVLESNPDFLAYATPRF